MTSYVHGAASRDSGLGSFVYSVELRRRVAEEIRQVSRWRFKKREKGKETKKKKKEKKEEVQGPSNGWIGMEWSGVGRYSRLDGAASVRAEVRAQPTVGSVVRCSL